MFIVGFYKSNKIMMNSDAIESVEQKDNKVNVNYTSGNRTQFDFPYCDEALRFIDAIQYQLSHGMKGKTNE